MKKHILWIICAILVIAPSVALFLSSDSEASDSQISDSNVCVQSVALAFYYHNVTDLDELQSGVWRIISNPELDDYQTLAYLTVFHTVQQIAMNVRKKPEVGTEEFWLAVLNRALVECEYQLNSQRFPSE